MEKLDVTSLENALNSLIEVINIYSADETNLITRDSMIQRFEYTYSIALKMIKRFFSQGAFVLENIEGMTFNEMIRQANKMELLKSNLEKWDNFRQKRKLTSHTYDENVAKAVVLVIEDFAIEVDFLLNSLKEKIK